MLDKRPCVPRTSSSRSLLIPCDGSDGDTAPFCIHAQVTEKTSSPALCSPCKVVIGFDVEVEKKPPIDVCESPRSVLESSAVLSSQDKQQAVARSPRSGLGSLLAANSRSEDNVGSDHGVIVCNPYNSENHDQSVIRSPSKVAKTSDHDPTDDDVCACQGQGLHVELLADMEDELMDADITPLRMAESCLCLKDEIETDFNNIATPRPLSFILGTSVKGGGVVADTSLELKQVYASPSKDVQNGFTAHAFDEEKSCNWIHTPGHTLPMNSVPFRKGEVYVDSSQGRFWHQSGLDVEVGNHQSIFSASSPPPCPRSLARASSGFLKMCNFCGRSLHLGKDIFMYRGDQPFCSAECRYQKIVLDESKDKKSG